VVHHPNQGSVMKKLLTVLGGAGVLLVGLAAPAWAHIEPTVEEAPAGGELTFALVVPHGCEDDSDTVKLEVQMPEGVESATPQFLPGWEATVDDAGPVVVTWEGGPLPHDQFMEFGLSVGLPDTPGETVLFPTIQTCESGAEVSWIEETPEGGEEPDHPAPAITLTEAEGEGHDHSEEEAAATTVSSDDDGSSDSLAVVALIVGALGLLAGGYAVMSSRRAA
ncbi:MAG TPA: YcnI family protein, partial [Acidimicrobiales bacterium]